MESEIKWLLLKIIYEELNLAQVEEKLTNLGIIAKKIVETEEFKYAPISKYFFLKNDIVLDNLSIEEVEKLRNLYNKGIEKNDLINNTELIEFIKKIKLKLLFPKTNERYIIWDALAPDHMTPSDSIVLAFHYLEFQDNYPPDIMDDVIDTINSIQQLSSKVGYKIAVLMYNERLINARTL